MDLKELFGVDEAHQRPCSLEDSPYHVHAIASLAALNTEVVLEVQDSHLVDDLRVCVLRDQLCCLQEG